MTHPPAARPTRRTVSALALAFGLTACGDSTAPLFGTRVSVSVSVDDPIMFEDVPGEPRIRCAVTFRATGSGGESARWYDATFKFFAGPDRAVAVDSAIFPASEIGDSWGGATLRDGQSVESRWIFELGAPFVVTAEYRYLPANGAAVARASARFACGPEPSANSPPPTITDVTLSAPWDGLEPGDVLHVSYTVNAPLGVWATAIGLSGACEKFVEFGERLATTASRTRTVQIPADCVLNAPLYVTVYAADAALRLASRVAPGPLVVDHTPPALQASLISRFGIVNDLGAVYFVRDTIEMNAWASDNNAVRWIVYELLPLGLRDSVAMSPSFGNRLRVPLRPEMTGSPLQLRIYARDAAGLTSAAYTTPAGLIHVYPTVDRPTLQTTFDGHAVMDMVIDTDRGRIYALQGDRRIRVLNTTTLGMIQTIGLPYVPTSVDFTPSGDSLIVTHQAGIGVIDLRQPTPALSEIPVVLDATINQQPTRVVVLGNGKAFVTLSGNAPRANVLLELNPATGEQRVRTDAADASGVASVYNMQRTPDGRAFVFKKAVDRFGRYDVATDQFTEGGVVPRPSGGGRFSVARDGAYTADGRLIYDASLTFVRRVESIWGASSGVWATALSADGEYLYIGGTPGLMRSRVSDGRIIDRTMNPVPADIFRVASDDSFVVTATEIGAAQVSLIRMR